MAITKYSIWGKGVMARVFKYYKSDDYEHASYFIGQSSSSQDVAVLVKKYGAREIAREVITGAFTYVREWEVKPTKAEVERLYARWKKQGFVKLAIVDGP